MPEDDDRETSLEWLREPPGAHEVRLFLECGEEAELSAEARQALERLMNELNSAEVQGYAMPGMIGPSFSIFGSAVNLDGGCAKLSCQKHDCAQHDCGVYSSYLM